MSRIRLASAMFAIVLAGGLLVAQRVEARDQWTARARLTAQDQDQTRLAYDRGYREGSIQGERDGRDRRTFDYARYPVYRDADRGYDPAYGDLERYRREFREGYSAGYRSAYDRFAPAWMVPRGNDGDNDADDVGRLRARYDDYAFHNGYIDGYAEGAEAARKHREPDYGDTGRYRSADHNYRKSYGPEEVYRRLYRDGFREGYERAYSETPR